MAHVVFIHGIDNKPDPEDLLARWREALASRGGIDLAHERITSHMVYWADVLYATPRVESVDTRVGPANERADPVIVAELAAALSGSPEEAAFVAGLCGKFSAVCLRAAAEIPRERELPERVPLPWLIKEPLMAKYLRDAHHYLFNADFSPRPGVRYRVRDEIRQRFVAALSDRGHTTPPCIVVSHSMGTVIAYDCLLRVPDCAAIDGLMTIGSPLGLDEIEDKLQPGWTRRNGFPSARVHGSWVNVFDLLDPVDGFDPRLANDYQQNGRQVIRDIEQSNWGWWRHDIAKYLAGSPLRAALRDQLGLPIVASSAGSTGSARIETATATKPRSHRQNAPIVTYHDVASLLGLTTGPATEGVVVAAADGAWESVEEAAETAVADRRRRTALVSGFVEALGELGRESAEHGPRVLNSPRHQLASILQSVVAEHQQLAEPTAPALELTFDKRDRKKVLKEFFGRACYIEKHDQLRPRSAMPDKLADNARLFLVGDFGTGLYGAPMIASTIARGEPFDVLLHLGDIYYSGQQDEVEDRFLKIWPQSAGTISRNLNGNHDMYSGGFGYFDVSLDAFEQESSYFALQNRHWLLVCLDTAYKDNNLSKKQLAWLGEVIVGAENRRIILFSHHPLFSNFKEQGAKLAEKLHDVLHSGQVAAWYWGHEHRCVIYDRHPIYGLLGRCLGHGGMPYNRDKVADMPVESIVEEFLWRRPTGPLMLPALYLDGPNPYVDEEPEKYGPHGYMTLELDGPSANEAVCDATGTVLFEHTIE